MKLLHFAWHIPIQFCSSVYSKSNTSYDKTNIKSTELPHIIFKGCGFWFLVAELLCNFTPSLTQVTFSFFEHVSVVFWSFWVFFTVFHLDLERKPFLIVRGVKIPGIGWVFCLFSYFRKLSFCGPYRILLRFWNIPHFLNQIDLNHQLSWYL